MKTRMFNDRRQTALEWVEMLAEEVGEAGGQVVQVDRDTFEAAKGELRNPPEGDMFRIGRVRVVPREREEHATQWRGGR